MQNLTLKTALTFSLIFIFSITAMADTFQTELKPKPGYGASKHRKRGTGKRRACNGKRIFNPRKNGF